jgi:glycosyltransferase involved in cell wall biosynthesis/GT2 family glycosyltransferase
MDSAAANHVSVVVPTYRRPADLRRCLVGLAQQTFRPTQTVVVRRAGDGATAEVLSDLSDPQVVDVVVAEPGVIAAMSAGVAAATTSDIVAFIDDDAAPHAEWLQRLTRHFADPRVGGVGGRDIIVNGSPSETATLDVGRITRWGKLIGNHHLGTGPPREVMVLKGVSMAFRSRALALPEGLRGSGAQAHFEVGVSFSARRQGWRLVYDPSAVVDHYVGPRFDADRRERPSPVAVRDAAYNLVKCLVDGDPELFWRRTFYGLVIGDRTTPGLARATVALLRREGPVIRSLGPSLVGQVTALRHSRMGRANRHPARAAHSKERPRVALLAHDVHNEGGMERACLELLARASDRIDFVVVSSRLDTSVRPKVRWRRIPLPERPFPLKFAVFYLLAGLRLARERVDLVHTVGAIVPRKVDVASVHFCHAGYQAAGSGFDLPPSTLRRINTAVSRRLSLITERRSFRPGRVRLLACVSRGVEEEVRQCYPGVDVALTPNGLDHHRFRPDASTSWTTRHDMGIDPDECVVLFVGGDWDRKGLPIAIDGLSHALMQGIRIPLWVVGPGDRVRFEALAAEAGVGDQVRFFGRRADTELFYRAADVFVMPTLYETFCLAAFEAAACGLPLVVTPVHGVNDLVGAGQAGICVERTPAAIGAALVRLAGDPELRASLGATGRRLSAEFTWERSVEAVLTAYSCLLPSAIENPAPLATHK